MFEGEVLLLKIRGDVLRRCRLFTQFESGIQQRPLVGIWQYELLLTLDQARDIYDILLGCPVLSALFEECEVSRVTVFFHVTRVHVFEISKVVASLRRNLSAVTLLGRIQDVRLLAEEDVPLILDVLHDFWPSTAVLDPELRIDLL